MHFAPTDSAKPKRPANAARFCSAPVLWRFEGGVHFDVRQSEPAPAQSARALAHSKSWRKFFAPPAMGVQRR